MPDKERTRKKPKHSSGKDAQFDMENHVATLARWRRLGYIFPVLNCIIYPLLKISLIALSSELLREVLQISFDQEIFEQIEEELYGTVRDSKITSIFLMEGLSFYQSFVVVCIYVLILAITIPLHNGINANFNPYMEVKRLQMILYDNFMLKPNSVDIKEARQLVYESMSSIEKYWSSFKYEIVGDITLVVWSLTLIFLLSWDLGLITTVATAVIVFATKLVWRKLSSPWDVQRENKTSAASSRLMDLVTCKEVVLSHTMELEERASLFEAVYSDEIDIRRLFWAKVISSAVKHSTFLLVMPFLFVYVNEVDLTMERVFQLLLVVVIQDEMVKAYLNVLRKWPIFEEYARAKGSFSRVLGVKEEELFPPDFATCSKKKEISTPKDSEGNRPSRRRSSLANGLSKLLTFGPNKSGVDPAHSDVLETLEQSGQHHQKLALQHCSLGYLRADNTLNLVIEDMSLDLAIGEHYALMGETGAGKSTLFKVIAGLIPMVEGRFSVGGIDVDTTSRSWRRQLGVVSQDTVLLNRTLRENLSYGLTDITDDEIHAALEKVNLRKLIDTFPEGLDMELRYNGNEFSGGQQQRMQIARLLLKDSPVILLDEMTSALDPQTTMEVLDVLKEFIAGKTLVMVTHDTYTLTLVNHILHMRMDTPIEIQRVRKNAQAPTPDQEVADVDEEVKIVSKRLITSTASYRRRPSEGLTESRVLARRSDDAE